MKFLTTASVVLAMIALGCGDMSAVDDNEHGEGMPEGTTTTEEGMTDLVAAVDVEVPGRNGDLYRGVAIVSMDMENRVDWLLEGVGVVLASEEGLPPRSSTYDERQDEALAAVSAGADAGGSALVAFVFESDDVVAWQGSVRSRDNGALAESENPGVMFSVHNEGLSATTNGGTDVTSNYYCASASANGSRTTGSTATGAMRFYSYAPYPSGTQIYTTKNVSSSVPNYSWSRNYFSSFYYVTLTQTSSGAIQVNNTLFCY